MRLRAANPGRVIALVLLTLAFHRVFVGVDRHLATLVVIFGGVMPALLALVGTAGDLAVLTVVRKDGCSACGSRWAASRTSR